MKYLANVLHAPNITKNLVCVGQMVSSRVCRYNFSAGGLYVEEYKKNGKKEGRIFTLDVKVLEISAAMFVQGLGVVIDVEI